MTEKTIAIKSDILLNGYFCYLYQ